MRKLSLASALLAACLSPTTLPAATRQAIVIPAGPLGPAIAELARQGGIDIGSTEPGIAQARTRGVRGHIPFRAALDRLLAGTGYRAVALGEGAFRIERAAALASPRRPLPASTPEVDDGAVILVTASKRDAPILRYPGSVTIVGGQGGDGLGSGNGRDLHAIASRTAVLQTTELGDGRNKLFVRGIADSSFAGPTRSTANVYLGEVQLGYNGADPNLNLYDIDRIEILEGPQGALYGAGSIGGVIRLTPKAPDPARLAASATSSIAATEGGDPGYAVAAMLNLPVGPGALRIVGYRTRDGGYIDDVQRRRQDVNRSLTQGARAAARILPGDGWTVDLGLVAQRIRTPDSQYSLAGLGLARTSAIAQPFKGDFQLAQATIGHDWDSGLRLVSATGIVRNHMDDRFDATARGRPNAPIAYDTHDRNHMLSQEMRLSRSIGDAHSWLIGMTYIDDRDAIQRELGPPGRPQDIAGVTNVSKDLSAFGEATLPVTVALSLSAGGRLTHTRTDSDPAFARRDAQFVHGRRTSRFSPMLGADWLLSPRLAWYARYGSGFRTGGLAVAPGVGRVANFTPDRIRVVETGVRLRRRGPIGLSASAALSHARWTDVQADLIDRRGFPYTTNIGEGRIDGFEASFDWVILPGLDLTGSLFANHSRLADPVTALAGLKDDDLPDTPRLAATGGLGYRWNDAHGATWNLASSGSYAGHSHVGLGPRLNLTQGNYTRFDISAGWQRGMLAVGLAVDNIVDTRGNRFALGNSFGVADRNQRTPLRPRTARLSVTISR